MREGPLICAPSLARRHLIRFGKHHRFPLESSRRPTLSSLPLRGRVAPPLLHRGPHARFARRR